MITRFLISFAITITMLILFNVSSGSGDTGLTGTKAPEFEGLTWLNSEPLTMNELKGKVVLIRFWLVGCPYCENTASSLVEFHEKYGEQGLVVIGIHHPKSERTREPGIAKRQAEIFGFDFPVAHDKDWKTIKNYWLTGENRKFTSSSMLIDRGGIIRFVHEGGEYYRSDTDKKAYNDFQNMDENIRKLLREK